jgi:hypothetical protein
MIVILPDYWNSLAVRADGPNLWALLNHQPIISATDASFDSGSVSLMLIRDGNLDDEDETAVALKNLRMSALANGDPARAPIYQQP